jgi:hypothetical protein
VIVRQLFSFSIWHWLLLASLCLFVGQKVMCQLVGVADVAAPWPAWHQLAGVTAGFGITGLCWLQDWWAAASVSKIALLCDA